jgi:hypothetical protein
MSGLRIATRKEASMNRNWIQRSGAVFISLLVLGAMALTTLPTAAAPFDGRRTTFADERFAQVWARTDSEPVRGGRTWYWGPGPWFDYAEFYRQGEQGLRTVQYFDKARMELNNPRDRSGPAQGVTNGLLVKELVSGRMQLGNDPFDVDQRLPAEVPVAGNPRDANPSGPAYGAFAGVASLDNGYRDPQRLGERIATTLDAGGNLGLRPDLARPETAIVQYNSLTGHNIPQVFWNFMNQQGPIFTGRVTSGPVVDWLFAMGLPITDAYWTRARIGASEQDVLVQLFERRVLTYVPSNPPGYQVEMGNVGQHYFQWRYPHLGQPWAMPEPRAFLLYASNVDTGRHWELYRYDGGNAHQRITFNREETVAFSWRRSWDPGQQGLLIDSRRADPQQRMIYDLNIVGVYDGDNAWNARLTPLINRSFLEGQQLSDYNPSASPDGTKLLYVSDRYGSPELFLQVLDPHTNQFPIQLTSRGCVHETPTWSPDGRRIYWVDNCDGDFELYRADLVYNYDSRHFTEARLQNVTNLTNNNSDDRFARVSPDGRYIAYAQRSQDRWNLAVLDLVSGTVRTPGAEPWANDEAPSWSPDGQRLAFASDRSGNYEIYTVDLSGTNLTRITSNGAQNRWPLWAQ